MKRILRKLLWRILGIDYGHILRVMDNVYLSEDPYSKLGNKSYNNNALVFRWDDSPINIGKYTAIANGVRFITDNDRHLLNAITSYPFRQNKNVETKGITIGNDVWIGQNCIILPGVTIGDGATIAAGAVVDKNVSPYTVVGGVPARLLKEKCSREEAAMMQRIAWWDWTGNEISERMADFKLTFSEFIQKYGK